VVRRRRHEDSYAIFLYRFNALSAAAIPLSVQFSSFASVVLYIVARYPVLLLPPLGFFVLRRDAYRRDLLGLWLLLSLFGASIGRIDSSKILLSTGCCLTNNVTRRRRKTVRREEK